MSSAEPIGALLAHARLNRGWSQLRLAGVLCGISGTTTITRHEVSRWEREERVPSGYWLGWLAVALDLPIGRLERAAATSRRRRGRLRAAAGWAEMARRASPVVGWAEYAPGVYVRAS